MKILFILLTMSFLPNAFASKSTELCEGADSCIETRRVILFFTTKSYYARGFGDDCQEAKENANKLFESEFGTMDCGLFSGPHRKTQCTQQDNGESSQWIQCHPSSGISKKRRSKGRCVMIGGVIAC